VGAQNLRQGLRPSRSRRSRGRAQDHGGGKAELVDGKPLFEALLQSAMEGFFADPLYGGNRNKVSWRMVGYPGLPAAYADKALDYRGKKVAIEPQSIGDFS
jgi:gluconate 2-dehydrogenase gamma chain